MGLRDRPRVQELDWSTPMANWQWTNRRIAHKWCTGWDFATFRGVHPHIQGFQLYYRSTGQKAYHRLEQTSYGVDKDWVVIAKEGT